jgi:hypothetical protein
MVTIKDQVNYLKNILCEEAREFQKKNPLVGLPVSYFVFSFTIIFHFKPTKMFFYRTFWVFKYT